MRSREKKNVISSKVYASREKRVKGFRVVEKSREEQGNEVKRWEEKCSEVKCREVRRGEGKKGHENMGQFLKIKQDKLIKENII